MLKLGLLLQEEDPTGAETWWLRAKDAGQSEALHYLGTLYKQRGRSEDAEQYLRQAADYGYSSAMFNFAVLLQDDGRSEEAETFYRRAA
ncbi:tetratricopeptide repeat protein [Actinomadura chokoriensis]|uniref:Tetratricopeptide repeat protein n=1 Tax=Actinomadura chokoriensis TaxID=454156 RepID=A0ABV4R0B8_9ACTN